MTHFWWVFSIQNKIRDLFKVKLFTIRSETKQDQKSTRCNISKPDTQKPDTAKPDTAKLNTAKPDVALPDVCLA